MNKRKLDQFGGIGFAVFIIMFIAYVIITFVYFEAIRENPNQAKTEQQEEENNIVVATTPEDSLPKGTVLDLSAPSNSLLLLTVDDIDLLPENTPQRFVSYMRNTLPGRVEQTSFGCLTAYQITKISNVNVSGSIGSVDPTSRNTSDTCTRGLSVVWYLDEVSWTWLSENFGVLPACDRLAELPIYTEFIAQCQRLSDSATLANPNGSIKNR